VLASRATLVEPVIGGVANIATIAKLAVMYFLVALVTVGRSISEGQIFVAIPATDRTVPAFEWKLRRGVVEAGFIRLDCP